ncbi:PHP domain-containing protein [Aphanothece hegewaldii CCALA 016]|uniref:PHP domain-containing protein n=1 Tax=Aphanothece hegewaldii CCALA 016 TaxID=2107694 RepID=A0A2T1LS57_9CHRO|nr:PHP domain-containing protein [Aphanothece hegewaldii]PSF32259.1 PHP domain-containing protein [Aphanothece hegewaldii CCALA 016]
MVLSIVKPSAFDVQVLKEVWANLKKDSCPYHYNFHMHTNCSDGQLSPVTVMEQAAQIGLKGLAITDHHSVKGYQIAQAWLDEKRSYKPEQTLPHLWTGVEVTSDLLGTEVHLLGYGFLPEHPAMSPYLQGDRPSSSDALAVNVIRAFHQAGGLAVLAHPSRYQRAAEKLIPDAAKLGIDGVEAYYAYGNPKPWIPSVKETEIALEISQIHQLYNTCGTDTHGKSLLQRI